MQYKKVYFIGIGGIGMSALARYFLTQGYVVGGYDKVHSEITDELVRQGADVIFSDEIELFKNFSGGTKDEELLIIYTPAIPESHAVLKYLQDNKRKLYKRAEVLGMLTQNTFSIAIAGTHGKTTISSIVSNIFSCCHDSMVSFLGGIANNINSNYFSKGAGKLSIVEADEFDRSFLNLAPDIALISSMDADHLDIYGDESTMHKSFNDFAQCLKSNGKLIVQKELEKLLASDSITYSINESADYTGENIKVVDGYFVFDIKFGNELVKNIKVGLPGIHNVENALGAFAVSREYGLDTNDIVKGIESYTGVRRRFEYVVRNENLFYIDDYAHHPKEIKMCIASLKELHKGRKITGIFQPHLYSRTNDFHAEFARELSELDELILLDIYPARELPIEGVTSEMIYDLVTIESKELCSLENLISVLAKKEMDILVTMGAGDIGTKVTEIKELIDKQTSNYVS